jgi:signal transduction histidine kinase
MGIIASAVGVEEIRKRSEEALRESERQLHHLSAQLLATQENERKRIATQLHDSIGQSLSAIKFSIEEALEKLGENGVRQDFKSLHAAVPITQDVVDEVRRIQKNLRPSMLDDLGIVATLGWFCRDFATIYSGIQVERIVAVREGEVPEPLKIVLFRIVQEAMNNVAKHSRADRVELNLKTVEDGLELRISDNGVGFDVQTTISGSHPGGLGVSSMRERTELSGGVFTLETLEGKGTAVAAFWPWRAMESSADTGHPA